MSRAYRALLLAFPRRIRREFGDEMAAMFEAQVASARAAGESVPGIWVRALADAVVHGGAERLATLRSSLGDVTREARRWRCRTRNARRWRWWMSVFQQDVRHALRLTVRQPGLTLVALLTLALGIGANTAIFSAVDAVLLRPLPYDEPDQLVMVWEKRQAEGVLDNVVAPADYVDWAKLNATFESIAAYTPITVDLTGVGEPVRLAGAAVSPAFFDVFRTRPQFGRTFRPEEGIIGNHRVVMLGQGLWLRMFGSDPSIVGRQILLNGVGHEVVGVLPATFQFADSTVELWAPLALEGQPQPLSRADHQLFVYARMKPGVTLQQARADMDGVGAQLSEQFPVTNRRHGVWVSSLADQIAGPVQRGSTQNRSLRGGLLLVLGAVGFVLLIACVNVASLLLARAAGRRREMAVRAALGAGRGRLVGQTLTESVVLGLLGGLTGLLVAYWGIQWLRQLTPDAMPVLGLRRFGLDLRVLSFTLALSLATGIVFGFLPAWHLASQDLHDVLKDGTRTGGLVRRRLRLALVVGEIALASVLLVGAGLTLRSFQALLEAQPGFAADGVVTTFVSLPGRRYGTEERRLAAFSQLEERLAALPGVRAVGATNLPPLSGQDGRLSVSIEGFVAPPDVQTRAHPRSVTPGYFKTMGIEVVAGRAFTSDDRAGFPLVGIVNDTMARRYWPNQPAVGRRLVVGGTTASVEVVGVVADVRHWGLDSPVNPELYLPLAQRTVGGLTFVVSTDLDPASLAAGVRDELRALDPDLPASKLRTMNEVAAQSVAPRRVAMLLLAILGVLALALAASGIYGVMAHLVALRSAEIGVRMTLGARPVAVMLLVLREGLVQAAFGLAIGLSAGALIMQTFRARLFEVSPADPLTFALVAAILLSTVVAACLIPARRAMHVDPIEALRSS
jgi:putative ABC transport system permease protein